MGVETNVLFLKGGRNSSCSMCSIIIERTPCQKNASVQVTWLVDNLEARGVNITSTSYIERSLRNSLYRFFYVLGWVKPDFVLLIC